MTDLDEEGYPTEAAEEKVRAWPYEDAAGLMAYMKSLWQFPDYFRGPQGKERVYLVSTAGWSGNEQLIDALQRNGLFWAMYWYGSRRGGHYEFRLGKPGSLDGP